MTHPVPKLSPAKYCIEKPSHIPDVINWNASDRVPEKEKPNEFREGPSPKPATMINEAYPVNLLSLDCKSDLRASGLIPVKRRVAACQFHSAALSVRVCQGAEI